MNLAQGPFSTSRVSVWIGGTDVSPYIRDFELIRRMDEPMVDCRVTITIPEVIAFGTEDAPNPEELVPRLRRVLRVPADHQDWEVLHRVERLLLAVAHGEPMATSSAMEMLRTILKDPQIWPNLQARLKAVESQLKMEVALMTLRTVIEQDREKLTHE